MCDKFFFFISVKMCSVSPVDELHALGQTLVKINMFIQKNTIRQLANCRKIGQHAGIKVIAGIKA
jgi:hypothetical protein